MILEDATYETFGYEIWELKPKSNESVLAACELCGDFRITKKCNYHTFCNKCIQKGKKHTEETKVKISAKTKGDKNPNYGKLGKDASGFRGGPSIVKSLCVWCNKEFSVLEKEAKKGGGKYCCYSCAAKARIRSMHNARPHMTVPEKTFEQICTNNNLPFRFVGDGALWLGNANPDFVHNTKKIVVEIFGDYWHSPLLNRKLRYIQTLEGRKAQLEAEGYKSIFIWESDLKRKDGEAFVLYLMCMEGIKNG